MTGQPLSRRTFTAYAVWLRKFYQFTGKRAPQKGDAVLIDGMPHELVGIVTRAPVLSDNCDVLDEIYREESWPKSFLTAYSPSWWEWRRRSKINQLREFIAQQGDQT